MAVFGVSIPVLVGMRVNSVCMRVNSVNSVCMRAETRVGERRLLFI